MPRSRRLHVVRTALVALVATLAGAVAAPPASASADQVFPVGGPDFERARQIAHAHWGAVPCQGQVTYVWSGLEPLINARASWSNPTDAWNNAAANFECEVAFNTLTDYDFPMLCTVMAHEVGHLLGRPHDAHAGLLMSAIYSAPIPECQAAAPAPPAPQPAAAEQEGIAWNVTESRRTSAKKARSAKKTRRSAKRRTRCVVRMKAGKRVRRCVVLKKRSFKKRGSTKARTAHKAHKSHKTRKAPTARKASVGRSGGRYRAH